jgi:hypothetical protein
MVTEREKTEVWGGVKIQELPYKVMGSRFSAHKTVIADAVASRVIIRDHSEKQAVPLPLPCRFVCRFCSPASCYSVNTASC